MSEEPQENPKLRMDKIIYQKARRKSSLVF